MDIFTHALLGGTLAYATASNGAPLGVRERVLVGGAAAAFPDIDFLAFPLNPLLFLSDWHQGPTHSLVLLPLWSALIAGVFWFVGRRPGAFATAFWVSAMGLASHILADVITAYGTAVWYPLSASRFSIGTTFVIDPLFSAIIAVGLGVGLWTQQRSAAVLALTALCVYVSGQGLLRQRAIEVGWHAAQARHLGIEQLSVVPQPFSPFNWKLIGVQGPTRFTAHVNLVNHPPLVPSVPGFRRLAAIAEAYQAPAQLIWVRRPRFGDQPESQALVEQLWHHPKFAAFRRFAVHPGFSPNEGCGDDTCVWFTDLRYDLPTLPDTFRYGFCHSRVGNPWQLYRVRYFSQCDRQMLTQELSCLTLPAEGLIDAEALTHAIAEKSLH